MALEVFDYRPDVRNIFVSSQMRSRFLRMVQAPQDYPHLGREKFLYESSCLLGLGQRSPQKWENHHMRAPTTVYATE
ncbi:MAG: hypothetical protein OXG13_00895 [Gemmatimonadaceae bacterium]|nr:hypothetical protein [Gemmatimonadaceae bacterium]